MSVQKSKPKTRGNVIDYPSLIKKYPWVIQRDQDCILSPDIDGLLCGLLMTHYLNWRVAGFYEGKTLLLMSGLSARDCIFLDMEILRGDVRSVGHHMNVHSLKSSPPDFVKKTRQCINPNLLRGFDRLSKFSNKYPLATIHLLMYILENRFPGKVVLRPQGLSAIFFADGVWKILFKYTKNVLDWFEYLHSGEEADWWKKLKTLPVLDLIREMDAFLVKLDSVKSGNKFGHINLSPFNTESLLQIITTLSVSTGWAFDPSRWATEGMRSYQFTKKIYGQDGGSKSNEKFLEIWEKNPLSLAMTEGTVIQYTIEGPDSLP